MTMTKDDRKHCFREWIEFEHRTNEQVVREFGNQVDATVSDTLAERDRAAKADLPADVERKLSEQSLSALGRWSAWPSSVDEYEKWFLLELQAAARVAVAAKDAELAEQKEIVESMGNDLQTACDECERLRSELASLRRPVAKVTVEEAWTVLQAWNNSTGEKTGREATSAAIDILLKPRVASAVAAERERQDSVFSADRDAIVQHCNRNMQAQRERHAAELAKEKESFAKWQSRYNYSSESAALAAVYEEVIDLVHKYGDSAEAPAIEYAIRRLAANPQEKEDCPDCHGTGDGMSINSPCPGCGGSGRLAAKPQEASPLLDSDGKKIFGVDGKLMTEVDLHECPTFPECECGLTQAHDSPPKTAAPSPSDQFVQDICWRVP